MLKKTILLSVVVAISSVFAQGMNFGVRAGLNLASIKIDEENDPENSNAVGFHVGAIADMGLNSFFYIQPGFFLNKKGAESHYSDGHHDSKTSLWYLEIPLLASVKIAVDDDLAVRINAGPYLGFGITGTIEHEYTGSTKGPDSEKAFQKDRFNRSDIGLAFGAGVVFQNFYAGINYDYGLISVADSKVTDIYNRCLGFTLGYNL